jgi:hypothetical protein
MVSVRVDPDQHNMLKLMAARFRTNTRTVMLAALDDYLDQAAPWALTGTCCCVGADAAPARAARRVHAGMPVGRPSAIDDRP